MSDASLLSLHSAINSSHPFMSVGWMKDFIVYNQLTKDEIDTLSTDLSGIQEEADNAVALSIFW
jgi:hypothetical protein